MAQKAKVLVVDDDKGMVKTICDILNVKGHEAIAAYAGEEAVEKVRSDRPDCVLMDMRMPGLNGAEALQMIKGLSPELPVVLMSANATEELENKAKEHGARAVLTKPIDIQMLLSFLSLLKKEESILLVDDDPDFSSAIKDILESRGYMVVTEDNPGNVLRHLQLDKLTVLLDLKLSDINGLEVLTSIRAAYPAKPVVLITGYREEMADSIEKGFRIGAYTCLYKPFEIDSLVKIIEEIRTKKISAVLGKPFENSSEKIRA